MAKPIKDSYSEDLKALIRKNPQDALTITELRKRYPWIVKGSLEGSGNERTVLIKCTKQKCTDTRRVRTQDAYQCKLCETHQRDQDAKLTRLRRRRWREREKAKRRAYVEDRA
jgi:hypothetical protein